MPSMLYVPGRLSTSWLSDGLLSENQLITKETDVGPHNCITVKKGGTVVDHGEGERNLVPHASRDREIVQANSRWSYASSEKLVEVLRIGVDDVNTAVEEISDIAGA